MKYNSVLVFICFFLKAVYAQNSLIDDCPKEEVVEPCKCSGVPNDRRITCDKVNDPNTLRRVFRNLEGYRYQKIRILHTTLQYIPHEIFENTSANYLELHEATLSQIFDAPPNGVQSITYVRLQKVRVLRDISWSFFQGFTNLKELDMIDTPVGILGPSFSQYMSKSLETVWFYNATMKEIKPGALSKINNLQEARFISCNITSITRDIFPQRWINGTFLSLSGNKISSIPEDLFTDMPNLKYIDMGSNFISEVIESAFQRSSVDRLELSGNPLSCDCQMLWLLKKELVKEYTGVCSSPKRLEGKPIQNLTTSDFQC